MASYRSLTFLFQPGEEGVESAYFEAIALARKVGERDAQFEYQMDRASLRLPFSDVDLACAYQHAYEECMDELWMDESYPRKASGHMLYCPRGCNTLFSAAGYDECAACGALMTPHCEEAFSDALERAGQLM